MDIGEDIHIHKILIFITFVKLIFKIFVVFGF